MPNWCENKLVVVGSESDLDVFINSIIYEKSDEFIKDMKLLAMNKLHPGLDPEKYPNNWKDWRLANWGTKWECEVNKIEYNKDSIILHFDSAWSPPIEFIDYISKTHFPNLHFRLSFIEMGIWFCGVAEGMNGNFVVSEGEILVTDFEGKKLNWDNSVRQYRYESGELLSEPDEGEQLSVVYFKNSLDV